MSTKETMGPGHAPNEKFATTFVIKTTSHIYDSVRKKNFFLDAPFLRYEFLAVGRSTATALGTAF